MADPSSDDLALLCPHCGYDLRATAGDRCSECGHRFDRAALQISGFPWAHRRELGRLRAYLQTVWLITLNSPALAYEAARPQDPRDARSFHRLTTTLLAAILLAAFTTVCIIARGLIFLAIQPGVFASPPGSVPRWLQDLAVPWSAGATLPFTLPLALTLFAIVLTATPQSLFRLRDASPARQQRLTAIALYTTAPLAFLLPAVLTAIALIAIDSPGRLAFAISVGLIIFVAFLLIIAVLATAIRAAQWAARVRHAGLDHTPLALAKLLALWSFTLLTLLGLLPWSLGFLYIVLDSLR